MLFPDRDIVDDFLYARNGFRDVGRFVLLTAGVNESIELNGAFKGVDVHMLEFIFYVLS